MLLRLTTALIGGLTACAVMAADFQPVDTIKAAALGALPVGADAEATLDPALRLPRCGAALVARVQGSNSVEVGCPDGWRLFVPVRVRRSQTVLVLSRGGATGETLTADAFVPETRDASRIVGAAVADPAQAVGRVARRTLSAGAVLSATDLVAQRLIRRGDNVALVSRRGGVEVRVVGKALGVASLQVHPDPDLDH